MLRIDIAFVKNGSQFFYHREQDPLNEYDFDRENISPVRRYFLISFAICSMRTSVCRLPSLLA